MEKLVPEGKLSPAMFAYRYLGMTLYPWQMEAVEACRHRRAEVAVVAANGSGKTAAVTVVLLLWWLYAFPKGRCAVTSGSWQQLENQLWPALRVHEHLFSTMLGWTFNDTEVRTPQGGFITAFSTKDPGRAEGYHENVAAGAPLMVMVDEAKSVPEPIFDAMNRCTPTVRIMTSSPGVDSGTFYRAFNEDMAAWHTVEVDAWMCPHIPPERIARAQRIYGPDYERNPIYRSMIMGKFTTGEDSNMIPRRYVEEALMHRPAQRHGDKFAAVDWAAGGDETVLAMRCGNALRIVYKDRERDTVRSSNKVVALCREHGVEPWNSWGDVCGMGIAIMQAARDRSEWRFREFNGGQAAGDADHFVNLNAEAWFYFRQSLERGEVCFPDGLDQETVKQLTDRKMQWDKKGRYVLEAKSDMAARGVHSPDRADALVMAWWAGRFASYYDEPRVELPRVQREYVPVDDWDAHVVL